MNSKSRSEYLETFFSWKLENSSHNTEKVTNIIKLWGCQVRYFAIHTLSILSSPLYKVKQGICPTYISDLFNQQRNQCSLRNSDFVLPCFNTVMYGKHSIKYLGPTLWRRLPGDIRNVTYFCVLHSLFWLTIFFVSSLCAWYVVMCVHVIMFKLIPIVMV